MKIRDLIQELRVDLLDDAEPEYLWSNSSLLRSINEAVLLANSNAALLTKEITIGLVVGQHTYNLPCSVTGIKEATLGTNCPMPQTTHSILDERMSCCWINQDGEPEKFIIDGNTIRFYPAPKEAGQIKLVCWYKPCALDMDSDLPINPVDAHALLYWAAYRAFLKPDVDEYDPKMAEYYKGMFEDRFGKVKSEKYMKLSREMGNNSTLRVGRIA